MPRNLRKVVKDPRLKIKRVQPGLHELTLYDSAGHPVGTVQLVRSTNRWNARFPGDRKVLISYPSLLGAQSKTSADRLSSIFKYLPPRDASRQD